jgi:hypothetical protein
VSNEGASRTPRDITGLGQGSVVLSQRAAVVPIDWFAGLHSGRGVHGAVSLRAVFWAGGDWSYIVRVPFVV